MNVARLAPAGAATVNADPLAVLEVIDLLQVGPVIVEPKGLRAVYRIHRDDRDEEFVHEVRFDEKVFDPTSSEDQNLAAMVAAQPAVSYGLFCREMYFAGPYDDVDQQFLRTMLSKMAREIFVKKLLGPNPFLADEVRGLPAIHLPDFLRARVSFENEVVVRSLDSEAERPPVARWPVDRGRYAVLSNGGKSSLLSHGLLEELEVESHPIFLDVAERSWKAAGPAYEHFRRKVPQTARISTNAEQLAGWILGHLTILRPPGPGVHGDDDPVRLWTMASLSFTTLPLLRRQGIGRLVRGGAYDTTRRTWRDGIPHHDGLYDRSHYIDRALTRYFRSKGWTVTQFSLLRTLSELLIERVLADRYPHLLRLQLSCRNPRNRGSRAEPCRRCEECLRTIAMLLALDTEPEICGFRPADLEAAQAVLTDDGIRQELAATEHLAYLLHAKGSIPQPKLGNVFAKQRPEIEKLRVDPERSPLSDIPVQIRQPLLEILLDHSDGAVLHTGSEWIDIGDSELERLAAASEPPYRR
jgi:hypothetical protein